MSSLDEIKQKKLEELRRQQEQATEKSGEPTEEDVRRWQQKVDAIEEFVKRKFTKEAHERYGNLKAAHPEKALQLITVLAQIIDSGSLQAQINDEQLRMLLSKMSQRRDFTITRR